jgi:putative ABC transport system permease protein
MLLVTLKGLLAHKLRFLLTATAVVLGVAFMAGTLVFTDTLDHGFKNLFENGYSHTDAIVRSREAFDTAFGDQRERVDLSLLDRVRALPSVERAAPTIEGYAQIVDKNGKAIGNPAAGAPTLGGGWISDAQLSVWNILPGGRAPVGADEIVIDKLTAKKGHLRVGDTVTVMTQSAPARFEIVGIALWGDVESPMGATYTLFTQDTAERLVGEAGKANQIVVRAREGVSQTQLKADLDRALASTPKLEVLTGAQAVAEGKKLMDKALGFFHTFLLVFALIALFVGAFIIFNTFSIVVAQRVREMALMRAIGASRAQVLGRVVVEAVVLGIVASAVGLFAGLGLAVGLRQLLAAFGLPLPGVKLQVNPDSMIVAFVAGLVVTLLSAVMPARRASSVPPVAAMRDVALDQAEHPVRRGVSGGVMVALGAVALALGLYADVSNGLALVGLGVVLLFVGIAVLSPLFARPVVRFIGWPVARLRGMPGQLARENAVRNPSRTSATAAALMIGVAIVSLITVVTSSMKSSVNAVVQRSMRADFVVTPGGMGAMWAGFSPELAQRIDVLPEVDSVMGIRMGPAQIDGSTQFITAGDPKGIDKLWDLGVVSGSIPRLGDSGIAVSQKVADDKKWAIGSRVPVTFARSGVDTFVVEAIYKAREATGDYLINTNAYDRNFVQPLDMQVLVKLADGVSVSAGRAAIGRVLAACPNTDLLDQGEFRASYADRLNQMLNLVYALLALAVVIALIGIANTLALSIHERTRELGLLRAVGVTRAQLKAMIRWEAVMISLLGGALGIVVGAGFGWTLAAALRDQGITRIAIPVGSLAVIAVMAWLAGVIAAVRPARRAARLDVLRAITTE